MKRYIVFIAVPVIVVLSVLAISSLVFAQSLADSQTVDSSSQSNPGLNTQGDDSNPVGTPEIFIPEQYQPTAKDLARTASVSAVTIYFTPQDENTSTTVLFLYNTNTITATVGLQTFYINGSLTISTTLDVPPLSLVRICADTVNTVSASWQDAVLINMTTFSAYAKMTLPAMVKAEGYVAWDTTGEYDPLVNTQTLPLRFSTDPATVLMPLINRKN